MGKQGGAGIDAVHLERYLRAHGHPDARVVSLHPLGQSTQEDLKSYGYGRPLQVTFTSGDATRHLVVRTMAPDPFGHERRGDRAANMVMAFDTFASIPRHIQALDYGTFSQDGELLSAGPGEFFLVTNYVEGELYARDLKRLQRSPTAAPLDSERAAALGAYLADLHAQQGDPATYARFLRDTVGSGEGIFGLCDSYPADHPVATPERLQNIERAAVAWRWRLRAHGARARRTHGDFHPFNLLFRQDCDFSVLDCSRGGWGDPADDVTCLSVNYLFFALQTRADFDGPLRQLWERFWATYNAARPDPELNSVVAPFFAWRALVLAHPSWYPSQPDSLRDRLLRFAERLLGGAAFTPGGVDALLR